MPPCAGTNISRTLARIFSSSMMPAEKVCAVDSIPMLIIRTLFWQALRRFPSRLPTISMFHVGRVLEVFSADDKSIIGFDNTAQALLDMWDENMITVAIDSHLTKSIKKDDIVLVDYTPIQSGQPRMTVIKILRAEVAKRTWKNYKDNFEKLRAKGVKVGKQSYVG